MRLNLIRNAFASVSLLAIIVLLTGCPYSSNIPIDEGTVAIAPGLAGKWISTSDTAAEDPTYYIISKEDQFHATAKKMEYSESDSAYTETAYHLTFSDVNGDTFMNAMEDGSETYSLYKFRFDAKNGAINTSEVTDYIKETFKSSPELKDYIIKNKSNSYFFTNTNETYIRK